MKIKPAARKKIIRTKNQVTGVIAFLTVLIGLILSWKALFPKPISVSVSLLPADDNGYFTDTPQVMRYKLSDNNGVVEIKPNWPCLNENERKKIPVATDSWESIHLSEPVVPTLDVKIINHADKTISPERVVVLVSESKPVKEFVLHAQTVLHGLWIENEGWKEAKSGIYRYNFIDSSELGEEPRSSFSFESKISASGRIDFSEQLAVKIASVKGKETVNLPYGLDGRFFRENNEGELTEIGPDEFYKIYEPFDSGDVRGHLNLFVSGVFEVEDITGKKFRMLSVRR